MTTGTLSRETPASPAQLVKAVIQIDVDAIDVGPNVRVNVAAIDELAASITEHGVLQPIKVRSARDRWIVVWGQRRLLAARKAGLAQIPAITTGDELSPVKVSTEQLVENLHRADLNPIDRAKGMRAIVDSGVTQAALAKQLGLAPSTIANDLRLLETHAVVQHSLEEGQLTAGHARAIATLDVDLQPDFAERVVSQAMSAHEAERQARFVADDAKRIRQRTAAIAARAAEAIELLGKVANPEKVTVGVIDYMYGGDSFRQALKAAGWSVMTGYLIDAVAEAGACGCAAWRVEIPYNAKQKVTLKPGCVDAEHRQARQAAEQARFEEQRKAGQAAREAEAKAAAERSSSLAGYLAAELAEAAPSPFVQRLAIYALVSDGPSELGLDRYWDGDADAVSDLPDPAWTLLEAAPDGDLSGLLAQAIAEVLDDRRRLGEEAKRAIDAALAGTGGAPPAFPERKRRGAIVGAAVAGGATMAEAEAVADEAIAAGPARLPRGRCATCDADVALRKGGQVREHGQYDPANPGILIASVCPGSGSLPAAAPGATPA